VYRREVPHTVPTEVAGVPYTTEEQLEEVAAEPFSVEGGEEVEGGKEVEDQDVEEVEGGLDVEDVEGGENVEEVEITREELQDLRTRQPAEVRRAQA
jgi:hypothetical protein